MLRKKFSFIDLFAGIGGFRIALEELGGECRGYSEIDNQAIKVYRQNFIDCEKEEALGDITKIEKLPEGVDIVVGGVPCQPWSIAGKQKGFDDPRGKVWFDVIRLLKDNKPKAFVFENVKGLANPKNRDSFRYLLYQFEEIGFEVRWKIINSYDYGVPQDRERVFIVGIRNDVEKNKEYIFPTRQTKIKPKISDVIGEGEGEWVKKNEKMNDYFIFSDIRDGETTIHSWDLIETEERERVICETILKNRRKKRYGEKDGNALSWEDLRELINELEEIELRRLVEKKILRIKENKKYEFVNSKNSSGINDVYRIYLPIADRIGTITATGTKDYIATVNISAENKEDYKRKFIEEIYKPKKFKEITARDCRKLQGFPEWFKSHEKEEVAKKQFGNAVTIQAVYFIAKELIEIVEGRKE